MMPHSKYLHFISPLFHPSNETCKLHFWVYQERMLEGLITIAIDNIHHNQLEVATIEGNDTMQYVNLFLSDLPLIIFNILLSDG